MAIMKVSRELVNRWNGMWIYISGSSFGNRVFCSNGTLFKIDPRLISEKSSPFVPMPDADVGLITGMSPIYEPSPTELVLSNNFFPSQTS